jgi:thiamine-phosphate pyrophosphorylase
VALFCYITDRSGFSGNESARRERLLEKICEATHAGVDYIQLREKDLPTRELEALAREVAGVIARIRGEKRELRTALLINSRTDVALAVGADGVHLRSDDVSAEDVRAIWRQCGARAVVRDRSRQSPVIGVSCHSRAEVTKAAAKGADFAVFGPVFEKKDTQPAGLERLHDACREKIPVLALGGVTLENAGDCLEAGAAGIAAIRLFQENSISEVIRHLRG